MQNYHFKIIMGRKDDISFLFLQWLFISGLNPRGFPTRHIILLYIQKLSLLFLTLVRLCKHCFHFIWTKDSFPLTLNLKLRSDLWKL